MSVLVRERNAACAGAATVYRRGGSTIESSMHEIDGFDEEHSLGGRSKGPLGRR
jgi:hypothetical protein